MAGKVTIKRYFELLKIHARMDLGALLRDTKFMLLAIFSDICSDISAISGIFLLAWKFGGLGGLNRYEVLFMLAFGGIVNGIIMIFDSSNASYPSRIIGRGQWEHMFIMPLPFGVQLTSGFFPFTCSGKLVSSIIMMWVAATNLSYALPWWWGLALIGNVIISMVIILALSYWLSSLAFYAPVQCEEISSKLRYSIEYTATFPLSGMPPYMKFPLLSIFPAGLIAWLPTLIILGKAPSFAGAYQLIFAALVSSGAYYFFRKGFKYYVQKGINRYVSGGHRR